MSVDVFNTTEPMDLYARSGAESGIPNKVDDDDKVELEKSNVLLMGPTGSGIFLLKHLEKNRCTTYNLLIFGLII